MLLTQALQRHLEETATCDRKNHLLKNLQPKPLPQKSLLQKLLVLKNPQQRNHLPKLLLLKSHPHRLPKSRHNSGIVTLCGFCPIIRPACCATQRF